MGEYKVDNSTGKMILLFDKQEYLDLPQDIRSDIKRYFNFSRYQSGWVSKGQADSWMPKSIAERLNFKHTGNIGEKKTFAEKMEQKAERAALKAERYAGFGESARSRQRQLQSEFDKYRGDIAFLTQPGRIPWREKIVKRYERGFEEAEKAKYFEEESERLERSASMQQLKSPRYLDNRIKENEAILRSIERDVEQIKQKGREVPEYYENKATETLDKLLYYKKALDDLGGIAYNQSNISKGDLVKIRGSWSIVKGTGPKNLTVEIAEGGAKGFVLKYPYAEIKEKKTANYPELKQPVAELPTEPAKKVQKENLYAKGKEILAEGMTIQGVAVKKLTKDDWDILKRNGKLSNERIRELGGNIETKIVIAPKHKGKYEDEREPVGYATRTIKMNIDKDPELELVRQVYPIMGPSKNKRISKTKGRITPPMPRLK